MSYTKQNFKDGDVLTAENLNHIEDGIVANENAIERLGGSSKKELPDYWEEHLDTKIKTIRNLQRAGGKDCFSFVVITDFHHGVNPAFSPKLIKRIADACDIKYCLCLGDIQTGAAVGNKEDVMKQWDEIHDIFAPIKDFTLMTGGNHDGAFGRYDKDGSGAVDQVNEYYCYNLTREEIYDVIFRQVSMLDGVNFSSTGDGYYVDDKNSKARYIVLNSHYTVYEEAEDGTVTHSLMRSSRLGQGQYDLVVEALKTVPSDDWAVVVGCHMPICAFPGDGGGGDLSLLRNMLIAYQNRTTFTSTFGTSGEYDYVVIDEDFTAAKGIVIGAFSGHMHNDLSNTDYAFPIVVSAADNYGSYKDIEGGGITGVGELGTITEQSFDVFTVNKRAKVMHATKIGKGSDRIFTLDNGACLINLNLSGAKSSNDEQFVAKNGSYQTTLTTKAGTSIESVSVVMGGEDITASAYINGIISIANVTDDVYITVTTTAAFDNLADPTSEDWHTETHYLTDGELAEIVNATYRPRVVVTNFIPVIKNDILRFKGLDRESGVNGSDSSMYCYDENKAYLMRLKMPIAQAGTNAGFPSSCVADENGVISYEILLRGDTNEQFVYKNHCDNIRYVRFCAKYTDSIDSIAITVNQEII